MIGGFVGVIDLLFAFYAVIGIIFASLRRFCAVAAKWNSSLAPFGPLRRSRSSFMMRLR